MNSKHKRAVGRVLTIGLVVVVFFALAYDLINRPNLEVILPLTHTEVSSPYQAHMVIDNVHYEEDARSVVGTLTAEIVGATEINRPLLVGYRQETNDTMRWLGPSACTVTDASIGEGSEEQFVAALDCGSIALVQREAVNDWWYPFDNYQISLRPRVCVGTPVCITSTENVAVTSLRVIVSEPSFVPKADARAVTVTLTRPPVLRVASTVFLIMAFLFLVQIWHLSRAKPDTLFPQSLGLFATLWAFRIFLVPPSIQSFPTLVDYAVLGMFTLIFAVLLVGILEREDEQ